MYLQPFSDWHFRLSFTEIDPEDPSRIFSFVLIVNEEEKYDITNCNPKVDAIELVDILDELNESGREDISILARRMRKFCEKKKIRTDLFQLGAISNHSVVHKYKTLFTFQAERSKNCVVSVHELCRCNVLSILKLDLYDHCTIL